MQTVKNARVEFKTTADIKNLLLEASATMGMDLSNFIISTVTQKAKEVLIKDKMLTLSEKEWENFEKILNNPPKATKNLQELMRLNDFDE